MFYQVSDHCEGNDLSTALHPSSNVTALCKILHARRNLAEIQDGLILYSS